MKNLLLLITCILLLSCKKDKKELIIAKKLDLVKKEIAENELDYYNSVGSLGVGLIKPLTDSLFFFQNH